MRLAMSVTMPATAAHQLPTEVNLHNLTPADQRKFHTLMDTADQPGHIADHYLAMATAAQLIGIHLPAGGVIVLCSCGCGCATVCDADQAAESLDPGTGVQIAQCPACIDDHRNTGE